MALPALPTPPGLLDEPEKAEDQLPMREGVRDFGRRPARGWRTLRAP
jgi:hypothetical protein